MIPMFFAAKIIACLGMYEYIAHVYSEDFMGFSQCPRTPAEGDHVEVPIASEVQMRSGKVCVPNDSVGVVHICPFQGCQEIRLA